MHRRQRTLREPVEEKWRGHGREKDRRDRKSKAGLQPVSRGGFLQRGGHGGRAAGHREKQDGRGVRAHHRGAQGLAHPVPPLPPAGEHRGLDPHGQRREGAGGGQRLRRDHGGAVQEGGDGDLPGAVQKAQPDQCLQAQGVRQCHDPGGELQGHRAGAVCGFRLHLPDRGL